MEVEYRYRAFISYSHADEAWARWLHRALETYRVPRRLVGRETTAGIVPERIAPVFRDREELATATSLGETLTRALEQSENQIVICSPAAAKSRWVNEEVLTFKRLGRSHRIFCLLVGGEPGDPRAECFPQALIYEMGPDGTLTDARSEPIAADVRPGKDDKPDARLKLIAGMLGVGLDELKQRDAQRRHRRMVLLVSASLAGMAITSGLAATAWLARNEAERQRVRAEAEAETARQTTGFMVGLFKVSDPSEALGNRITAREILDKGAARIERELAEQPAVQATLMDTMGTVYTSLGLYSPAARLVRQAYEKRRELWGTEHPEVADSLNHLGVVLTQKADYAEAERHLGDALAVRRTLFGARSAEVAETMSRLAEVHSATGDFGRSEELIRESLEIRRRLGPEAAADVARSLEDLGLNFGVRGEYAEGITYLREALAMQRELHKGAHPSLAQAMDNLSSTLVEVGEVVEAEPLARLALSMKRQLYGDVHPEVAAGVNNLAIILDMRQDLGGAERAYREALAINRQLLGTEHPTIATNLNNLAFTVYARGNHAEGIDLLRQALEMNRRVLGPEHPAVAGNASSLAYWLVDEGELEEASRLVEEGLAIRIKVLGQDHPQVAGTLTVKANLRLAQRRYEEARQLAVDARAILLAADLPDDSWQVAAAKSTEGAALTGLRRYAEAEPLLKESLPSLGESPIPGLEQRGRSRLLALYVASGRPEEAERYR
jgi:tetratricopeptide (TPR) repeat protein